MRALRCGWIAAAIVFLAAHLASAQAGTAGLTGTVKDAQGAVVPGATVTATNQSLGTARTTMSNAEGAYSIPGLQPGDYNVKVELTGFRTFVHEKVELRVDSITPVDAVLQLGSLSETVTVSEVTPIVNTTDASVGNTMSRETDPQPARSKGAKRRAPAQPAARRGLHSDHECEHHRSALWLGRGRARRPAERHARRHRRQRSADAGRLHVGGAHDAGSAAGVPRPHDQLRRRDGPLERPAGLARHAQRHQPVRRLGVLDHPPHGDVDQRVLPRTVAAAVESAEQGAETRQGYLTAARSAVRFTATSCSSSPTSRACRRRARAPVMRDVPSDSLRDGVLMYQCANAGRVSRRAASTASASTHPVPAGWYGLTPAEIAAIDPLGIGPSLAASQYFKQFPSPNEPGLDGVNIMDFRSRRRSRTTFHTFIGRVDYKAGDEPHALRARQQPGRHDQHRAAVPRPGLGDADAVQQQRLRDRLRRGARRRPRQQLPLRLHEDRREHGRQLNCELRHVPVHLADFEPAHVHDDARDADAEHRQRPVVASRASTRMKVGTNLRFTRIPTTRNSSSYLNTSGQPLVGGGVGRQHAGQRVLHRARLLHVPAVAASFQAGYADAWLNILGVLSQATQRANYNKDGNAAGRRHAGRRANIASDEYEWYVQDTWQLRPNLDDQRRPALQPLLAAVRGQRPAGRADRQHGPVVRPSASAEHAEGHSVEREPDRHLRPRRAEERQEGVLRLGQEQLRAAHLRGVDAESRRRLVADRNDRMVVRGGYSKVFDRVGQGPRDELRSKASRSACRRRSAARSARRTRPIRPPVSSTPRTMPSTMPAAPAGGFPQTPPLRAGIITSSIDDTLVTPSAHMTNLPSSARHQPQLHDRGRLRRPLRPRPADSPRPRDAAEPDRPAVRRWTTSPRRRRSSRPRRRPASRLAPRSSAYAALAGDRVLGEPVSRRGQRQLHRRRRR